MPRKPSRAPYLLRRRWTLADARAALSALAASGLSVSTFAHREGLDEERLYRWRRRLAAETKAEGRAAAPIATAALIELRPSPRPPEPIEVVLKSGVTLRVAETIDPSALARLVAALRRC
jgi:transposase-like protein